MGTTNSCCNCNKDTSNKDFAFENEAKEPLPRASQRSQRSKQSGRRNNAMAPLKMASNRVVLEDEINRQLSMFAISNKAK